MKKALSYLLALAMVVTMFPAAAFADKKADEAMTPEKALEALKGYGVIKGDGTQDPFKPESELKRQDAAVILVRLLGVEKEAKALEVKEKPFMDIPSDDFYKSIIQYVKDKGIFKGISAEKFGFNDKLTAQQFATIQLRALGYEVESEDAYKKALETAKKMGLLKGTSELKDDTKILRKDVYVIMNNTLETPKKDGKKALKYELGLAQEPVAEKLEVVDATANGLAALKVEFTREVDEDTLKNIELTDKDYNDFKFEAQLSDDKKVATLVFDKVAKQNETYKVVVKDVKTEDKKESVEKFEKKILFVDTDRPVVNSVEVLNPRELVIAVSEPIQGASTSYKKIKEIKIDDVVAYGRYSDDFNGKLELTLHKALKEGDHKIVIDGLKDFADLPSSVYEQDIAVVDDKEAPAITEAKMLSSDELLITFSENVDKHGAIKVNDKNAKTPVPYKKSKKAFKVGLNKSLDMGAVVEVKVEYKGQKDIMGNEVKNWEKFTFSVADDTDLPTAEFKDFDKDNGHMVEIKFSKPMTKEGEFKLKDSKGKVLHSGKINSAMVKYYKQDDPKEEDKSILVFEFSKLNNEDPADYTLVLEKLKDATLRKNELPKTEIAFKGKDTKAPTVVENGFERKTEGDEVMYTIVFSEKMDRDTLLDKTNYSIQKNGDAAQRTRFDAVAGGKIRVFDDNTRVRLIMPAAKEPNHPAVDNQLYLVGLKDESGKKIVAGVFDSGAAGGVALEANKTEVSVNADGVNQIKFIFTKEVKIEDLAKFKLAKGRLAFNGDLDKFSKEFTFDVEDYKFAADLNKNDAVVAPTATVEPKAVITARGSENVLATVAEADYVDKIAPSIAKNSDDEELIDVDKNNPRHIKIEFTEEIGGVLSYSVADEDGKVIESVNKAVSGKLVTIILPQPAKTGDVYTVRVSVKDNAAPDANNSEVFTRKIDVAGVPSEFADALDLATLNLVASTTNVGKTEFAVLPALGVGSKLQVKVGEIYVEKNAVFGGTEIAANNEIAVNNGDILTLVEVDAAGKALKFAHKKITADLIGAYTAEPKKITIIDGSTALDSIVKADIKAGATEVTGDNGKQFKVQIEKADGASNQTAKVNVKGVASVIASEFNEDVELTASTKETGDITLAGKGKLMITVTITEDGKVSKVYTSELTIK